MTKPRVKSKDLDYPMTKLVQEYLKVEDPRSSKARKLRRVFRLNGQGIRQIRKGLHA